MDDAALALLRRQHGVIARSQALEVGMTSGAIRGRVRAGLLVPVGRGVYRHAAVPLTWHGRVIAHCLATAGVASHRTAASLHGLIDHRPGLVELTVSPGRRPPRVPDDLFLHQSTQVDRLDVVEIATIPTTGLSRTILDTAAVASRRELVAVIDRALRERRLSLRDLRDVLTHHSRKGRNGCGVLRAAIDVRLGQPAIPLSDWSRDVAELLQAGGLPRPELEHRVRDQRGRFVAQVDLAYPAARVGIELDSVRWHLDRDAFERDARRRTAITLAGWRLLTLTWTMTTGSPSQTCAAVRAALAPTSRSRCE